MSRGPHSQSWRRWVVGLGLLTLVGMGCSPSTLGFLFRDDKRQPEIPLPAKEGKKEVTVAILANSSPAMSMNPTFAGAERELASLIGTRMAEETKNDRRPIKVIEQAKVERFKSGSGQDWRTLNPAAIGKKLGADYVIDLTLNSVSIFQPEYGHELYQGRANVQVVVYDTEKPETPFQDYPISTFGEQKSTATVSPAGYRKYFLARVATEIAHHHVPYEAIRELPPIE